MDCNIRKYLTDFHKDKTTYDGYVSRCKKCVSKRSREWYASDPKKQRARVIARHGITAVWYDSTLEQQGGVCASCGCAETNGQRLSVDHDHNCCPSVYSCGYCVRDLLCSACNHLMGYAYDDPDRAEAAAEYLRKWNAHSTV